MKAALNVLITGTNKGIGNQLVKVFLSNNQNAVIYATSRQKQEVAYQRWRSIDKSNRVKCKYLDITSKQSILSFIQSIKHQQVDIDILVNNAGLGRRGPKVSLPDLQWVKSCFDTNVMGHMNLTESILPYLSRDALIVNVSSLYAQLKLQPQSAQVKFSTPSLTKQYILEAIKRYHQQVESKQLTSFCSNVYATSKMLLSAWSRFVVQRKWLQDKQKSICVTPGFCLTPLTANRSKQDLKNAFSAQSGALKIHETIFLPGLDSEVFYHRARKSDFYTCGQELPWQ